MQLNIAQVVKTRHYIDGSIQQQDNPLYYVFNVNTHDGFVIIAAVDAAVPILGYSMDEYFDPSVDAVNYRKWPKIIRNSSGILSKINLGLQLLYQKLGLS